MAHDNKLMRAASRHNQGHFLNDILDSITRVRVPWLSAIAGAIGTSRAMGWAPDRSGGWATAGATRYVRRRHHGGGIVAQVERIKHFWQGSVSLRSDGPTVIHRTPQLAFRASAEIAADDLIRTVFVHACTVHDCGEWVAWPSGGAADGSD
jgi:hypothetical protein